MVFYMCCIYAAVIPHQKSGPTVVLVNWMMDMLKGLTVAYSMNQLMYVREGYFGT